jgi:5'-3' exonuclease
LGNYVFSKDSDVLMFGGDLLRLSKTKDNNRKKCYKIFKHKKILKHLDLDHEGFVLLCLSLGTDFNNGIKGLGPKKALAPLNISTSTTNTSNFVFEMDKFISKNTHNLITIKNIFDHILNGCCRRNDIDIMIKSLKSSKDQNNTSLSIHSNVRLLNFLKSKNFDLPNIIKYVRDV